MTISNPGAGQRFDVIEVTAEKLVLENRTARREFSFPFILIGLPLLIAYPFFRTDLPVWVGLVGASCITFSILVNLFRKRYVFDSRQGTLTVDNRFQRRRQFWLKSLNSESMEIVSGEVSGEDPARYYSLILTVDGQRLEINRNTSSKFIKDIRSQIESMISNRK